MFSLLIINIILILVDSSIGLISFEKFKNQVKNNTVHPHLHLSAVSIFHLFNSINSILSVISKVIEKILCNQSMVFLIIVNMVLEREVQQRQTLIYL